MIDFAIDVINFFHATISLVRETPVALLVLAPCTFAVLAVVIGFMPAIWEVRRADAT